jgi:anti-sigma B factor antagonist
VELHERTHGDVVVVDVEGPVGSDDDEARVALRDTMRRLVERGNAHILLNVENVSYVDSVWLGTMVQAYASATRRGGALKLVHVQRRFRELLHVTKLDTVFDVFETEDEAAASFGVSPAPPHRPRP